MNLERLKSKKVLIIAICIIILTVIGVVAYFGFIHQAEKTVEISALPTNMEESIVEEPMEEEVDISELEETQENRIEENIQNKENTKQEQKQTAKTSQNTVPYYIKVNYGAQVVTIYKKDENGNYTVPVKAMVCSTGVATPASGVYSIPARWRWLRLQGYVYGQYCTQIKGNILFHSVPYLRKEDPASLEYWEYDKLGTYASAGCIRLTVADAMWIYNNCLKGTKVEFYSSSNPGPLGKPSAKKISSYSDNLRNWDPTDPNPNNPWKNKKEENVSTTSNKDTNTQTNTATQQNKNATTQTNTITQPNKDTNTQTNTATQPNKNTTTQTNTITQPNKNAAIQTNTITQPNKNTTTQTNTTK